MLILTLKRIPKTTLYGYLQQADISHNKWDTRNKGEKAVILCDKEILLTEELKLYLLYFCYSAGGKLSIYCREFSNLPMKEN